MKTAISLPDGIFKEADRFARRMRKSRSQLYAEAITEYLARHAPNAVTEAMNNVCDRFGQTNADEFTSIAAKKILEQESW